MNLLDLIFPKYCLECKKEGKYICSICLAKVKKGDTSRKGNIKVYSIWKYEGVIRKAIITLKYKHAREVAKELTKEVIKILDKDFKFSKSTILVPVPIHISKERSRGFNQTELLGKIVAQGLGIKYLPNLVNKTVSTKSQAELKGQERRNNLREAFKLDEDIKVDQKNTIIIFDDVLTTGSTIEEIVMILHNKRLKNLTAITLAN